MSLEMLDPETITVRNIRDAKPSKRLIASIRDYGVLQPIGVLRTPDSELVLRFGARRRLACIEVGCPVPANVIEGTAGTTGAEVNRIFEQLDENDNREAITAADRAKAVQDLLDLDVKPAMVARESGLDKSAIAAVWKVATSATPSWACLARMSMSRYTGSPTRTS